MRKPVAAAALARALADLIAGARVSVVGPEGRQVVTVALSLAAGDRLVRVLGGAERWYAPGTVLWCAKQRRLGVVLGREERLVRLEAVADGLPFHSPAAALRPATLAQIEAALAVRRRWFGPG